jgi:hypothetical protein
MPCTSRSPLSLASSASSARLLRLELVVCEVDELEPLEQHAQDECRFLQGELPADAGALPSAEGFVGVRRNLRPVLRAEAVRVERLGVIATDRPVAMEHWGKHQDGAVTLDPVLATEDDVLVRPARERWRGWPQPQCLLEDMADVRHLMCLGVGPRRAEIGAQHPVHLFVAPRQRPGILDKGVKREGQQAAGRLVAGNQEGNTLCDDVGFIELLARLPVHASQHPIDQVVDGPQGAGPAALVDDVLHGLNHELLVGVKLPAASGVHPALDRQFPRLRLRRFKRAQHGDDEGMGRVAVEGVEPVIEAAQRDRIQSEPRHVGRHIHRVVGVEPLPFLHELDGDIEHARVVAAHRVHAEGRQQHIVRLAPVRVLRFGGEQTAAGRTPSQGPQPACHLLVEARFVAQLVDQFEARHHEARPARNGEFKDGAVFARQLHQAFDRGVASY